jgi:hypothetical protein
MADRLVLDRVAIAPSTRTAIVVAVDCLAVTLEQTDQVNGAKLWDASSGGQWKALPAGAEYRIAPGEGPVNPTTHKFPRVPGFRAGDTVCWVEAVAGTGPIAVEVER